MKDVCKFLSYSKTLIPLNLDGPHFACNDFFDTKWQLDIRNINKKKYDISKEANIFQKILVQSLKKL